MAVRIDRRLSLTIAMPLVDLFVGDLRGDVRQAIEAGLADVNVLCEKLARGELAVC